MRHCNIPNEYHDVPVGQSRPRYLYISAAPDLGGAVVIESSGFFTVRGHSSIT